jgi:hypothetical protein
MGSSTLLESREAQWKRSSMEEKLNGRELSQVLEIASEADAFAASTSSSNKKKAEATIST